LKDHGKPISKTAPVNFLSRTLIQGQMSHNSNPMNANQLTQKQQELTKLRDRIRAKGYSLDTERSYVPAVAKFIDFLCSRSWPEGLATERKVEAFLTAEAKRGVAASTQDAKLHAILFYYRHVRQTPHHLRHAWATYAHANGATLRDLQEILGHKNIETTARYVRPDPERVPSPFESLHLVA
jgi:site-specific recombinase XerD